VLRSLFSGITGLRAHQTLMDVVSNNISNVNTTGFKSSSVVFEDTLSQLVKSAGASTGALGGVNPAQVGLGVQLGGISTNFGQGSAQNTGKSTDLMIQGDGFFVVRHGGEQLYTRNGSFSFDTNGRLVTGDGSVVQGWMGAAGAINTNGAVSDIQLPIGTLLPATPSSAVTVNGNLSADSASTAPITASIGGYDVQGNSLTLSATFTRLSPTSWSVSVSDGAGTTAVQQIDFAANGSNPSPTTVTVGAITFDLTGITSYAGSSTVSAVQQNGAGMGSLQSFSITPDGTLVGVFSNGLKEPLAQLCTASFNNPPGLERVGDSMYRGTINSGAQQLGQPGSSGRGTLQGGALEMSNVDLAQEFTNLVIAQRGFEANSKVITTSDELLQDLVNLKR